MGANRNVGKEGMRFHMSSPQWRWFYSNEGMPLVTLPMERMIWVGLNIDTFKLLNTTLYENENNNSRIKECLNNENEITSTKQQAENRNGIKEA